jgi:hypothetical protein
MTQIQPQKLWIGHAGDGRDSRLLHDSGIEAVVCLALEESIPQFPRELLCCRFPLLDGLGNNSSVLKMAIQTTISLIRNQIPTLVCCGAGMSRSPAIAAAALSIVLHQPPQNALAGIHHITPSDVSPGLWSEVIAALDALQS